jgi:phosphoglycolate phosphatase
MLVVFDWDGTLIDSAAKIVASMQAAAEKLALEPLLAKEIEQIIGLSLPKAIATLYPNASDSLQKALQQGYSEAFVERDEIPCEFFPGVKNCLETLKNANCRIAVATGKSRKGLDRVLSRLAWQDVFDATRCADETASKPNPLMLHELMQQLKCDAANTVMVGDTEFDLAMAKNAKVKSIGVSYGAHSVAQLERHAPISIIDDMLSLPSVIGLAS